MLQDKLAQLRQKYQLPEDSPQLDQWEQEVSNLLLVSSVAETEAVKNLLAELKRVVHEIDEVLVRADSKTLPAYDRDILLERKRVHNRVISYFDTSRLKDLEKEIDNNLRNPV